MGREEKEEEGEVKVKEEEEEGVRAAAGDETCSCE